MTKQLSLALTTIFLFYCHNKPFAQTETTLNKKNLAKMFSISGSIKDSSSGETLPYASIGVLGSNIGSISNQYGFYSITLREGQHIIVYRYLGYQELQKTITLTQNTQLDVNLPIASKNLTEVVVTTDKDGTNSADHRMSRMDLKTIKQLPSFGGEADLLRSLKLLPGVNSTAEGGAGITVRGGAYDQNLMLLDEATVYNANHLVGLYSTFNPNIIKDLKFYKSGIPASYSGRISSVMDVTQKDGNMKTFHVNGGISLIASNLTVEGPVVTDKSSFIIGARRSYLDMLFKYMPNENIKDVRTYFYDINAKVNYIVNKRNRVYLSCYMGNDLTGLENYKEEYGNITSTLRYNHVFSNRLFSNTSVIYSKYKMTDGRPSNEWGWKNEVGLDHFEFKEAFNYYTPKHSVSFGVKSVYYKFHPGNLVPVGDSSQTLKIKIPTEYALESVAYVTDNFHLTPKIEIQYGAAFSVYNFLGALNVYKYTDNEPKDPTEITDTIFYKKNQIIQTYHNIEPRLSIKYTITKNQAVKISYNKMAQYIQQVSNTVSPLPYNMWKASNNYIKPLVGHQYTAGYFADFLNNALAFSCELFYKSLKNVMEEKPGTDISLNKTIEAGLLQGIGRAYGLEMMLNKNTGKFTGMISYSWCRTEKQIEGRFKEETINFGKYYPSDYDIPHKLTLACEYKKTSRFSLTADFTYQTGKPITLPSGQYTYFNTLIPYYSDKNMQRLPDFHRLDVGATLKSKPKENRKWEGYWTFSIYNLYGHKNVYTTYIRRKPNTKDTEAVQIWGFSAIPSISYNFSF